MAQDPNEKRKAQILDRAKKTHNYKVVKIVEDDFLDKLDQAGPMAGIWLESLESDFEILTKKPDGLMKSFKKDDFDDLFKALFGYDR